MCVIDLIAIAITPEEQARGLKDVPALPPNAGMLFVYESAEPRRFWMDRTSIPLDIAFADADGIIIKIKTMVPNSRAPVSSGGPCAFALEVPAGLFARCGVIPGQRMRLAPDVPRVVIE